MELQDLSNQRKALIKAGDKAGLRALEEKVLDIVNALLDKNLNIEMIPVPPFYTLCQDFSKTSNAKLKKACQKAVKRLEPEYKQFLEDHGLTHLDELTEDVVNHNRKQIETFIQINPFEKDENGQLRFPMFTPALRVTDKIEITETTQSDAHEWFVETLIKMSQRDACTELLVSPEKITLETFLSTLQDKMELNLFSMFLAASARNNSSSDEVSVQKIKADFEKFLAASEG